MSHSRKITETESEDFANEQAEKFNHAMSHGDNFESVNLANVVSDLFNEDDLGTDSVDTPDEELPSLDLCDDEYNSPENYGTSKYNRGYGPTGIASDDDGSQDAADFYYSL